MKNFLIQSIRNVRSEASRFAAIGCLGVALAALPNPVRADVISWVGYQFGPAGGTVLNFSNRASFFHGDQWLNYLVPDGDDIAVFDTTFDLQQNGMPHDVLFGDFTMPVVPIYVPNSLTIPGGDAHIDRLVIRKGDFNFLFADEFGVPPGSLSTQAQMSIADVDNANASLTIRSRRLTTGFVTHIASAAGSRGAIEVDGPGAEGVSLAWVGKS